MAELYEYQTIDVSLEPPFGPLGIRTVEATANRWSAMGWRTVAVMPGNRREGYAILIERKKEM